MKRGTNTARRKRCNKKERKKKGDTQKSCERKEEGHSYKKD